MKNIDMFLNQFYSKLDNNLNYGECWSLQKCVNVTMKNTHLENVKNIAAVMFFPVVA